MKYLAYVGDRYASQGFGDLIGSYDSYAEAIEAAAEEVENIIYRIEDYYVAIYNLELEEPVLVHEHLESFTGDEISGWYNHTNKFKSIDEYISTYRKKKW